MFILLTDVLTCPRCGPEFGLLVQADRMRERRVMDGRLGCANCRETYPIRHAVADLRPGASPSDDADRPPSGAADGEAAVRLAALMGVADAQGMVMIVGPGARHAGAVAALVPGLEVIAVSDRPDVPAEGEAGVSRVVAGPGALPFRGGLRAAALTGGADDALLREALRVLAPGSRLVADPAPADAAVRLRGLGAEVLLEQDGVVVARAPGRPVELRYNAVR